MPRTFQARSFGGRSFAGRAVGGGGSSAADFTSTTVCGTLETEWAGASGDLVEGLGRDVRLTAVQPNFAAAGYSPTTGSRAVIGAQTIDLCAIRDLIGNDFIQQGAGARMGSESVIYRVRAVDVELANAGAPREGWTITDPPTSDTVFLVTGVAREAEGRIYALACRQNRKGQPRGG